MSWTLVSAKPTRANSRSAPSRINSSYILCRASRRLKRVACCSIVAIIPAGPSSLQNADYTVASEGSACKIGCFDLLAQLITSTAPSDSFATPTAIGPPVSTARPAALGDSSHPPGGEDRFRYPANQIPTRPAPRPPRTGAVARSELVASRTAAQSLDRQVSGGQSVLSAR